MANINKREIIYYDVSPYAALSAQGVAESGKAQGFSDVQKLFADNMIYRSIQTCEHNHTILDGTHREFEKSENIALWSIPQSSAVTRLLSGGVTLDITFGGMQSSPGITFYFDIQNNSWCDMLRVKWYKNSSLLSDKTFYPDSTVYSCLNQVDLYNKVTVEFMRMNMPCRYLKVEAVLFGILRVFGDSDLENLTLNEGFDPTGRTFYINSANFTINTKDPMPYIFHKRQPLRVNYNGMQMGFYYIDKSKKYADRRYSVEAIDKIGVLDASDEFMGGVYANISAEILINQIVGGMFDVDIDGSLKNIKINGWLPIMKKREALAQIALAIGAIIDATRTGYIKISPVPPLNKIQYIINKDRVYQSSSVDIEFPFTGIELTEHNFIAGTSVKELFKDTFIGEKTVRFSEPASSFSIDNGIILFSGANYAVINCANPGSPCLLSGKPYIDSKSSVVVKTNLENELEGTKERIEKIENGYLVNKNNSQAVAQRLYEYYLRGNVFDGDFLTGTDIAGLEKIGDTVKIATVFDDNYLSGQIEKLTLRLGYKNIKARGIIRGN
jgi:hypothetical protein